MDSEDEAVALLLLLRCRRRRRKTEFENTLNVVGLNDGNGAVQAGGPRSADTIREKFTEYFSSEEGSVFWQERLVGHKV